MSWSEEVVRRHISAVEARIKSSEQRKLQGYTLAKLCLKANLYSEAIWYTTQYLSTKGDDYRGHKLLGDIYRLHDEPEKAIAAYKRSLYFKKNQQDLIVTVGELYCSLPNVSEDNVEEWISVIAKMDKTHPLMLQLRTKLLLTENVNVLDVSLSDEAIAETAGLTTDPSLVINLVSKYLKQNQLHEAYLCCQSIQSQGCYSYNREWMKTVQSVQETLLKSETSSGLNPPVSSVPVMVSLLVTLSAIFELELSQTRSAKHTFEMLNLLIKYDSILFDATKISIPNRMPETLSTVLFELKGQLYFLVSQFLLSVVPNKLQNQQLGVVCLLATFLTPPADIHLFEHLPQSEKMEIERWRNKSLARHCICIQQLKLLSKAQNLAIDSFIDTYKDHLTASKVLFVDNNVFRGSTSYNMTRSVFASDRSLSQVKIVNTDEFISNELLSYAYIQQFGDVLPAVIWLCLLMKANDIAIPFDDWCSVLFPNLPPTTPKISAAAPGTLCLCDIEAFLVLCMNDWMQSCDIKPHDSLANSLLEKGFSWPLIIPPAHLVSIYNDIRQYHSPNAKNLSVTEGLILKKSVSVFISEVRGHSPLKLNKQQLQTLARHFQTRAEKCTGTESSLANREPVNILLNWSVHYWSTLLSLFTSGSRYFSPSKQHTTPKRSVTPLRKDISQGLFSPQRSGQPLVVVLTDNEREECYMSLANAAIYQHDSELALKYYQEVPTAQSSWNQSQIYVMLSESCDKDMKKSLLESALHSITKALQRVIDVDNDILKQKIEEEQKRIQRLLTSEESPEVPLDLLSYEATPLKRSPRPKIEASSSDIKSKTTPVMETSPDIRERDVKIASLEKQIKHLKEQVLNLQQLQQSPTLKTSPQSGGGTQLRPQPLFQPTPPPLFQPTQGSTPFQTPFVTKKEVAPPIVPPTNVFQFGATNLPNKTGAAAMFNFAHPSTLSFSSPVNTIDNNPISPSDEPPPVRKQAPPFLSPVPLSNPSYNFVANYQGLTPPITSAVVTNYQFTPIASGIGNYQGHTPMASGIGNYQGHTPMASGPIGNYQGHTPMASGIGNYQGHTPIPSGIGNYQGHTPGGNMFTVGTKQFTISHRPPAVPLGGVASTRPQLIPSAVPPLGGVVSTYPQPIPSTIPPLGGVVSTPSQLISIRPQPIPSTVSSFVGMGSTYPPSNIFPLGGMVSTRPQLIPSTIPSLGGVVSTRPQLIPSTVPPLGGVVSTRPQLIPSTVPPLGGVVSTRPQLIPSTVPPLGGVVSTRPQLFPSISPLAGVASTRPQLFPSTITPLGGVASTYSQSFSINSTSNQFRNILSHTVSYSQSGISVNLISTQSSVTGTVSSISTTPITTLATEFISSPSSLSNTNQLKSAPLVTNKPLPLLFSTPPTNMSDSHQESPASVHSPDFSVRSPDVSIEFTPIVQLPELEDIQSGEENEDVVFSERGKLYRYDDTLKQWKERGVGVIKILKHKEKDKKIRILMRREQVFKICCNHYITVGMSLESYGNTQKMYMWFTPSDYADEVPKKEKLLVKFKQIATASKFKAKFDECIDYLKGNKTSISIIKPISTTVSSVAPSPTTTVVSTVPVLSSTTESSAIATAVDSSNTKFPVSKTDKWECSTCYVYNEPTDTKCVACDSPKDGVLTGKGLSLSSSGGMKLGSGLKGLPLTSNSSQPFSGGMKLDGGLKGLSLTSVTSSSSSGVSQPFSGGMKLDGGLKGLSLTNVTSSSSSGVSQPFSGGMKLDDGLKGFPLTGNSFTQVSMPSMTTTSLVDNKTVFPTLKPSSDKWECSTCYVNNEPTDTKCVACDSPKDGVLTGKGLSLSSTSSGGMKLGSGLKGLPLISNSSQPFGGGMKLDGGLKGLPLTSVTSSGISQPFSGGMKLDGGLKGLPLTGVTSSGISQPFSGGMKLDGGLKGFPQISSQSGGIALSGLKNLSLSYESTTSNDEEEQENEQEVEGEEEQENEQESEKEDQKEEKVDKGVKQTPFFSFGELAKQHGGFSFTQKTLLASPEKVDNDADDDNDPEKEQDVHFKPIVSLCELDEIVTGEENDTILFSEHAKLFRNDGTQWKERGTGDIKILQDKTTNKCRCVMRRDQTLKICCNHSLFPGMILESFHKNPKSWLWKALNDISDGEVKEELFAVRFKTAELAVKFKDVFETACSEKEEKRDDGIDEEKEDKKDELEIEKEMKEDNIDQTEDDASSKEVVVKEIEDFNNKEIEDDASSKEEVEIVEIVEIEDDINNKEEVQIIEDDASSKEEVEIEKVEIVEIEDDINNKEEVQIIQEDDESFEEVDVPEELFEDEFDITKNKTEMFCCHAILHSSDREKKEVIERGQGTIVIFKSQHQQVHVKMTSDEGHLLCSHVIDSMISLRKPSMSIETFNEDERERTRVWTATADNSSGRKEVEWFSATFPTSKLAQDFQNVFQTAQTKPMLVSPSPVVEDNDVIFVGEELPLQDLIEKSELLMLPRSFYNYLTKPDCPGCIGCNSEDFSFPSYYDEPIHSKNNLQASIEISSDKKEDGEVKETKVLSKEESTATSSETNYFSTASADFTVTSFADLANSSNDFNHNDNKDFKFIGAGRPLFASQDNDQDDEDETSPEEEANIHFKPIVTLPENYQYESKEKEGDVVFSEKAKLYRFDNGQWKERGMGHMKMIKYSETGQTRLLMRRDQILKVCCNHYITSEMTIDVHMGNPKALWWFCEADFSEETVKPQKLAIRFKLEETAQKFKELFVAAATKENKSLTQEESETLFKQQEEVVDIEHSSSS